MLTQRLAVITLAGEYEVGFNEARGLQTRVLDALRPTSALELFAVEDPLYNATSTETAALALRGKSFDALLVCVATWSEDHHLLDLMEQLPRVPVILHAFPAFDTGSLCGTQQICSVFRDIGFTDFHYVYGEAGSPQTVQKVLQVLRVAALDRTVSAFKIGTIGGRAPGMTEIAWDELELKRKTGARVVEISERELLTQVNAAEPATLDELRSRVRAQFPCVTSAPADVELSLRYYLAMRALADEHRLAGLAVGCYTEYMGKVCLGYSLLSGEGVACGCEGDVNNTLMMAILQCLTGTPVHNTDLLYPDEAANTILFSHCGSGHASLAATPEEVCLSPVRLADSGTCVTFTARPGVVTLADLVGHGGSLRMSVMVGEAVPTRMEFPGNPLKVRFERSVLDICEDVAVQGMGHHWMAVYGDEADALEAYCRRRGIHFIRA